MDTYCAEIMLDVKAGSLATAMWRLRLVMRILQAIPGIAVVETSLALPEAPRD